MNEMADKKRIEEFDIVKGIAVILVICGHCILSDGELQSGATAN